MWSGTQCYQCYMSTHEMPLVQSNYLVESWLLYNIWHNEWIISRNLDWLQESENHRFEKDENVVHQPQLGCLPCDCEDRMFYFKKWCPWCYVPKKKQTKKKLRIEARTQTGQDHFLKTFEKFLNQFFFPHKNMWWHICLSTWHKYKSKNKCTRPPGGNKGYKIHQRRKNRAMHSGT